MNLLRQLRCSLLCALAIAVIAPAPTAAGSAAHAQVAQPHGFVRILKPQMVDAVRIRDLAGMSFQQAELSEDHTRAIDEFIKQQLWPMVISAVVVTGYSDRLEASENQHLAEQRAAVVRDYLIAKGIDSRRIYWEGRALPQPLTVLCPGIMERTELMDCLAPDRRVTIEVVGQTPKPLLRRSPGSGT